MPIILEPIGTVHTPFKDTRGMPIQPNGAEGVKGRIALNEDLTEGLDDLEGFSHIILIYFFHKSVGFELKVTPFLDSKKRGVFATRAPKRPNSIGISVVKLLKIEGNILHVENVDMLDGTPLLDIKPYITDVDCYKNEKDGWIKDKTIKFDDMKSDNRFE